MAFNREITTKDDYPLSHLLLDAVTELDFFNQAPRVVRDLLGVTVDETMFRAYTGDMTWEELAEGEHPRTGTMDSREMTFAVKTYGKSLGYTQEFIEDNGRDMIQRHFTKMVEGALDKEHEVVFDVVRNGWADGSQLWFDVPDHGAYTFSRTHDHTFADTQELFEADGDTDTGAHTRVEHIREASKEIRHHGMRPNVALMSQEFASEVIGELTWDNSFVIPQFEDLRSVALPDATVTIDGVSYLQTAYLQGDEVHVIAADEKPLAFHVRRPVTLTQGANGAPVGDPGQLIGAYGSARYGAAITNPLAGVKFTADNIA
jgi:hypothetical protein